MSAVVPKDVRTCVDCPYGTERVAGDGAVGGLMILGEAPGQREVEEGRSFRGRAGANLDRILDEVGVRRESVRITNVVMCRPCRPGQDCSDPLRRGNVAPSHGAVAACAPGLDAEIAAVHPAAILALGTTPAKRLYGRSVRLADVQGRLAAYAVRGWEVPFIATYHPSPLSLNRDPARRQAIRSAVDRCLGVGARGARAQ